MQDKNDKHGPRMDEEMEHETEGLVRSGHSTRAEESRDIEPVSDAPAWDPSSMPAARREGAPPGMSAEDVEERSALARLLSGIRYPARPNDLVDHVSGPDTPESAISALESLPDRPYRNLADVADELGYGREDHRF